MSKVNFSSKDILLLLLHAPDKGAQNTDIVGRTRIIKMMFLFQNEIYQKFKSDTFVVEEAEFKAYDFGPWSKDIYEDIDFLANAGFIKIEDSNQEPSFGEAEENELWEEGVETGDEAIDEFAQEAFQLTDLGKKFVQEKKWDQLSDEQKKTVIAFKEKFATMPLYALLRYVYTRYPGSTVKSKILDRVLGS